MNKIFVGLIFIFFHFNIKTVDILPDFIGYFLLAAGFIQLRETNEAFHKNLTFLLGFGLYSLYVYGVTLLFERPAFIGPITAILFQIFAMYFVYQALRDSETYAGQLGAANLKNSWIGSLVIMCILVITMFLNVPLLIILTNFVYLIVLIWYLLAFAKAKKLYMQQEELLTAQQDTDA